MSKIVQGLIATGLKECERPEGCPGAYSFHAYCRWDNPAHDFFEFPHEADQPQTLRQAKSQLRKRGWVFHDEDDRALASCPKCVRRLRSTPEPGQ